MPARDDLARQSGIPACAFADQEERGANPVCIEQVEDLGRHDRVGAIVQRQRNGVCIAGDGGQASPVGAEQR